MRVLPIWAKKPKHKMKVVATSKGWVVEKTGEVLVSHKGLNEKLKSLHDEMQSSIKETEDVIVDEPETLVEPDPDGENTKASDDVEKVEEKKEEPTESTTEQKPKTTKRRGRPPKNANSANKSK